MAPRSVDLLELICSVHAEVTGLTRPVISESAIELVPDSSLEALPSLTKNWGYD